MIEITETSTIPEVFFAAANAYSKHPFLAAPANPARTYSPEGQTLTYAEVAEKVRDLTQRYREAGYGIGHHVGLLLENRLEHFLHKLAMNALGVCCVPLNPDHRPPEMAYVIDHAKLDLVVFVDSMDSLVEKALALAVNQVAVIQLKEKMVLPHASVSARSYVPDSASIASVLYTSGTTGRPKGCLICLLYTSPSPRDS